MQRPTAFISALLVAFVVAPSALAEPPPPFATKDGNLVLPGPIMFESGKDVLRPESDTVLSHIQAYLVAKPEVTLVRIESHSDSLGNDAMNQKLTELRSMAIARWLVARGVACERLLPVGFGETKPIAPNDSAENRAQNRRTVISNAALKGRPIGGMPVDGGGRVSGDPCK